MKFYIFVAESSTRRIVHRGKAAVRSISVMRWASGIIGRNNVRHCNCFNNLLQYLRERDRMLSAYFVCSGFVYMVVVVATVITGLAK